MRRDAPTKLDQTDVSWIEKYLTKIHDKIFNDKAIQGPVNDLFALRSDDCCHAYCYNFGENGPRYNGTALLFDPPESCILIRYAGKLPFTIGR